MCTFQQVQETARLSLHIAYIRGSFILLAEPWALSPSILPQKDPRITPPTHRQSIGIDRSVWPHIQARRHLDFRHGSPKGVQVLALLVPQVLFAPYAS